MVTLISKVIYPSSL